MQAAAKKQDKFTYADYLTWDDSERWEIINGVAYNMSPAPNTKHQSISWEVSKQIGNFLDKSDKPCMAFHAPFDVRFPEGVLDNNKIIDVVQPDIVVICDTSKVDENGCHGAPDFIIEILSPGTAHKDHEIKKALYEKNGVKEYWIIDPTHSIVIVYLLEDPGKYGRPSIHAGKGRLEVKHLTELYIDLDLVFR
jgi:Uma2 family endonuclease